ncbi:class III signal peptide-containing protein [Pyrococcus yayanosii]|uniref:Class III signal peptide-containing protein n=1 Tax=Pyrococcus yayanosii (strain CH1 / JCM 16557) TaxID=529709 RepID=F8AHQ7_PYRYC|nr:class III signal peptide-containing protein [Pyrococcus yayanosii]AEH24190.1 hypothetical protein PYCH_05000 [Pyrococcus yayanosii CH1]
MKRAQGAIEYLIIVVAGLILILITARYMIDERSAADMAYQKINGTKSSIERTFSEVYNTTINST